MQYFQWLQDRKMNFLQHEVGQPSNWGSPLQGESNRYLASRKDTKKPGKDRQYRSASPRKKRSPRSVRKPKPSQEPYISIFKHPGCCFGSPYRRILTIGFAVYQGDLWLGNYTENPSRDTFLASAGEGPADGITLEEDVSCSRSLSELLDGLDSALERSALFSRSTSL